MLLNFLSSIFIPGKDDGIEFFGGTVNVSNVVLSTVSIARNASPSKQTITPSHFDVFLISLLLGVFFGILLVLSMHALTIAKNQSA